MRSVAAPSASRAIRSARGARAGAALSVLLSAIALVAAAEPESDIEPIPLQGKVLGEDDRPLADATVRFRPIRSDESGSARSSEARIARTGEDGRFSSGETAGLRFDVRVHAEGYAFWTGRNLDPSESLEVTLERGVALSGRVLAEETGLGLSGVTVRLGDSEAFDLGGTELETSTDDEGRYRYHHGPAGTVWVRATADGWATRSITGSRALDDIWLPEGGRVAGRIVDGDGEPVVGASVFAAPVDGAIGDHRNRFRIVKAFSDDTGGFDLGGITAGAHYRIHARSDRHSPAAAGPFAIEAGTEIDDVTLTLRTGAALRLRLVDPEDRPVTDVTLRLQSEEERPTAPSASRTAKTSEPGEVEIDNEGWLTVRRLWPGTFTLSLEPDAWVGLGREGVVLKEGETTDLGTLAVEPGLSIEGRVIDHEDKPVAGARVRARWRDLRGKYVRQVTTGDAGGFIVTGLPEHSVTIEAEAEGFAVKSVDQARAGDDEVVVTLDRHGVIRGAAKLVEEGIPSSFTVRVFQNRTTAQSPAEVEGSSGTFEIRDLDPGTYTLEILSPGRAPGRREGIRVRAGATTDAGEIPLEPGLVLRGRIVRADDGAAAPGARVRVDRGAGPESWSQPAGATAIADASGRFDLDGLGPVRYTLTVDHPEFAPLQQSVVLSAEAANDPLEVRLRGGGEIRGTVTDSDGLPVAGATIFMMRGMSGFDRRLAQTTADGNFSFGAVAPGSYLVNRTRTRPRSGFNSQLRMVEVREGEATVVDFPD